MVSSPLDAPHPIKIFNHDSISTIASIALHGAVLGLLLPGLSGFSQGREAIDPQSRSNVPIIELSPAEQSRLPDLAPTLSNLHSESSLDPSSGLSRLDSSLLQNSFPSTSKFPSFSGKISPLPPPPSLPPLNFNTSYAYRLPITTAPRPSLPPLSAIRSLPSPPPSALRSPATLPPYPAAPNNLPTQSNRPQFDSPRSPIAPDELINGRGLQNSSSTDSVAINRVPPEPTASAEDIRYQGDNTSDDEAARNNVRWMAKTGSLEPKTLAIAGSYPVAACPSQIQGAAILGVGANDHGQVTTDPYIIKSSGYPLLNRQALEQVKGMAFSGAGAYRVTLNFVPNDKVCPPVATGSPRNPAQPPTPPSSARTSPLIEPALPPAPRNSESRPPVPRSPVDSRRDLPTAQPEAVPSPQEQEKTSIPTRPPLDLRRESVKVQPAPVSQGDRLQPTAPPVESKMPTQNSEGINPLMGPTPPPFSGKK